MKKFILALILMAGAMTASARNTADNDTIAVNSAKIAKVIEDQTTNSKGKPVTKYYFLYDGELISTSKTVVEAYNLAQKYQAKCSLALVINRDTKRKRIVRI